MLGYLLLVFPAMVTRRIMRVCSVLIVLHATQPEIGRQDITDRIQVLQMRAAQGSIMAGHRAKSAIPLHCILPLAETATMEMKVVRVVKAAAMINLSR